MEGSMSDIIRSCHQNVLMYHALAEQYGLVKLKKSTRDYLNINLITNKHLWPILHLIGIEMMTSLIASPELIVNVTEQHVYLVLVRWMYRHFTKKKEKRVKDQDIFDFFMKQTESGVEFLLQEKGLPYQPVFKALRIKDVVINTVAAKLLTQSRIVPADWIRQELANNYLELIRIHEGQDDGPLEVNEADLESRGMRLCRNIKVNGVSWRWQGIMAGLFLSWQFSNNILEVMRLRSNENASLTNSVRIRHIICRATLVPSNTRKPTQLIAPTMRVSLAVGQKVEVVRLPEKFKPPVVLQVLLLATSPDIPVPAPDPAPAPGLANS